MLLPLLLILLDLTVTFPTGHIAKNRITKPNIASKQHKKRPSKNRKLDSPMVFFLHILVELPNGGGGA